MKSIMTRTKSKFPHEKPLNTIHYEYASHQSSLLDGLYSLWQKGELLDINLVVEGSVFGAHKAVLAASSDYFRAMFTDNMLESRQNEICLNGISAKGFNQLLEYAYTARLALNLVNVQDVLAAASHVQMANCIIACSDYLQSQIDLDNCVDIATIAETYSLKPLKVKVYRYMSGHLLEYSRSQEFYRLTPIQLEILLAYDFPVDCSEADVLRIVLSWFFHVDNNELDVRIGYAVRIMKYIHFKEITKRKLESILDKFFRDRKNQWQCLRKIIVQEMFLQTSGNLEQVAATANLLNSRGMDQAILKIGGFGMSGVTNEITYCFSWQRKWLHLTSIPHVEQCNYGTAVYDNELYIVGGCFNQSLQENIHPFGFKYNPRFNKWTTMSPMKIERCRFSLNIVGGLLYAVGGISEEEQFIEKSTCECYNPARDIWYTIPDLPSHISQHAGAGVEDALGNRLYISGGIDRDNMCVSNVYCFDTELEIWRNCAPLIQSRADHAMLAVGSSLYVCGGWTSDDNSRVLVNTIECYNPAKDMWEEVTKIPTPRYHAGIVLVENKIYFIGGFQSDTMIDKDTAKIEYYNIDCGTWTVESKYPQEVWEHTCVTLCIPKCRDDMEVIPPTESFV